MERIRTTPEIRRRLRTVAKFIVKDNEKSPSRRSDSSDVAPMVRLLGDKLWPVRVELEDLKRLEILMQFFVDPSVDCSQPEQVAPALTSFLHKIATNQLKIIPK